MGKDSHDSEKTGRSKTQLQAKHHPYKTREAVVELIRDKEQKPSSLPTQTVQVGSMDSSLSSRRNLLHIHDQIILWPSISLPLDCTISLVDDVVQVVICIKTTSGSEKRIACGARLIKSQKPSASLELISVTSKSYLFFDATNVELKGVVVGGKVILDLQETVSFTNSEELTVNDMIQILESIQPEPLTSITDTEFHPFLLQFMHFLDVIHKVFGRDECRKFEAPDCMFFKAIMAKERDLVDQKKYMSVWLLSLLGMPSFLLKEWNKNKIHGFWTRIYTEERLSGASVGNYVVRYSESVHGSLVISVVTASGIRHVLIHSLQDVLDKNELIILISHRMKEYIQSVGTLTPL